jgi:hypothetical protein
MQPWKKGQVPVLENDFQFPLLKNFSCVGLRDNQMKEEPYGFEMYIWFLVFEPF